MAELELTGRSIALRKVLRAYRLMLRAYRLIKSVLKRCGCYTFIELNWKELLVFMAGGLVG